MNHVHLVLFASLSLYIYILIHTNDLSNQAKVTNSTFSVGPKSSLILCINIWRRLWETTLIPTLFSCVKLVSTIRTLSFDQASLSNMGSEGSHNTQNDTLLAPSTKQRKKEWKRVSLQAKVDELEAQNNKIAMKNVVLQEQYEKLFETFHEARHAQKHEPIAPVEINHQLDAPQHGGSPAFGMDIPDRERATHRYDIQHETSLDPVASTRSRRSGGRHLFAEGADGSKAVFRDGRDFLKQRRENSTHISSKINDPRVSEILGPLPWPRPATNLGKGQQVLEKHEGTGDSEMFRQTYLENKYGESREKLHALDQTFLLLRGDGNLRKKSCPKGHHKASPKPDFKLASGLTQQRPIFFILGLATNLKAQQPTRGTCIGLSIKENCLRLGLKPKLFGQIIQQPAAIITNQVIKGTTRTLKNYYS